MTALNNMESGIIKPLNLFLIGISAGGIAAIFPRLMAFLSTGSEKVPIILFSGAFLLATVIFALIVGVSMIWLYLGTSNTTKNLFMAALALPSLLSGGINMSNTATVGQSQIESLSATNSILENKLAETNNIKEDSITFDNPQEITIHGNIIPEGFGISAAYAAEKKVVAAGGSSSFNPSVKFTVPTDRKEYILLFYNSEGKDEISKKLKFYQKEYNIPNLEIKKSKNIYYLIQSNKMTKSDALLKAIKIKEESKYKLSPILLKAK